MIQIFLRYIAAVTNTSGQAEIERATNVLLHSNEILEAFGNAKVNSNTQMMANIHLLVYQYYDELLDLEIQIVFVLLH